VFASSGPEGFLEALSMLTYYTLPADGVRRRKTEETT